MLDELTAAGEVIWSGHGALPGRDGWVALHPADVAPLTLPPTDDAETGAGSLEAQCSPRSAAAARYFAGQLDARHDRRPRTSSPCVEALWTLTWAGPRHERHVRADAHAARRRLAGAPGRAQARRARARTAARRSHDRRMVTRLGPPTIGGRWSLLPDAASPTPPSRAHARPRASARPLRRRDPRRRCSPRALPGGFAQAYRVLAGFEEAGHCRRGYVIEKLGAAQFAASATVDRLRTFAGLADPRAARTPSPSRPPTRRTPTAPRSPGPALEGVTHRPGRKAGGTRRARRRRPRALPRTRRQVRAAFTDDGDVARAPQRRDLAATARARRLDTLTVEKVNGAFVYGTEVALALQEAGFVATPRGYTIRKAV